MAMQTNLSGLETGPNTDHRSKFKMTGFNGKLVRTESDTGNREFQRLSPGTGLGCDQGSDRLKYQGDIHRARSTRQAKVIVIKTEALEH